MDIRHLTPDIAVAPQIEPGDMADLAAQGFTHVICNRPDFEVPPDLQADAMRAAAEAAGLAFLENPVENGGLTMDMVTGQGAALETALGAPNGKALAYCRSGTRSTIVWALSQAGKTPTDDLVAAAAEAGYDLAGLRAQIDSLARQA